MTDEKRRDDGGNQYPHDLNEEPGISRLDYLAGQIMAALSVNADWRWDTPTEAAVYSYDQAEALIAEGRKREREASK